MYRFLTIDDYNLYLTCEFCSYAKEHKIILFCLLYHSKHLIQSLNVDCFQQLKQYHTKEINYLMQLEDVEFGKLKFLAKFQTIKKKLLEKLLSTVNRKKQVLFFSTKSW